jgi:hypothetical protein
MLWRSQVGVCMAGYQPDESQVKPNTAKTARQIAEQGAIPPNLLPPPPAGAGAFTIVSGEQCVTARAPYLGDAERRRWLALLPDRPVAPAPPRAAEPEALLAQLIAAEGAARSAGTTTRPMPATGPPSVTDPAAMPTADRAVTADAPDSPELPFTAREAAGIAARIARGETKTEVVRAMPGYATRRHREFVAHYDSLAATLADAGLLEAAHVPPPS